MAYFVWPGLSEMKADIQQYEEDFAEKERKILEGQAIEARLPEFEAEIASLERKLGDVQQILPTNQETGDLLRLDQEPRRPVESGSQVVLARRASSRSSSTRNFRSR